jgi:hypothetical protein
MVVRKSASVSDTAFRYLIPVLLFLSLFSFRLVAAFGAVKQEVYVTATVRSFGGYTFSRSVQFTMDKPGSQEVGTIIVEGLYNGEYPWIMRLYTDNLQFSGVGGTLRPQNPAGLVSVDGRFLLPLSVHAPTFGEGIFRRIPDLNEPRYKPYQPSAEPKEPVSFTDCVILGIDPRNATWVAGEDGILFTEDDNLLGDFTVPTPFELTLRAEATSTSVQGTYDAFLYVEIVPAP